MWMGLIPTTVRRSSSKYAFRVLSGVGNELIDGFKTPAFLLAQHTPLRCSCQSYTAHSRSVETKSSGLHGGHKLVLWLIRLFIEYRIVFWSEVLYVLASCVSSIKL
jgi:hypothetical protein